MQLKYFESQYKEIVDSVLNFGELVQGRNGKTKSLFNCGTVIDLQEGFPLLKGRKMYYKGVFGEFAAMIRGPKYVEDFEKWGCNYWKKWSNEDGSLNLDYGNAWLDYNGINQIKTLVDKLKHNPNDRRLVVNAWRPDRLEELSLPCCHYDYQFYVRQGKYLDMRWTQRSTDVMIGLPSDVILGACWVIALANEVDLKPGIIHFHWGDTHIYEEHFKQAREYFERIHSLRQVEYDHVAPLGQKLVDFKPEDILIKDYYPMEPIKFHLKG